MDDAVPPIPTTSKRRGSTRGISRRETSRAKGRGWVTRRGHTRVKGQASRRGQASGRVQARGKRGTCEREWVETAR